MFRVHRGVPGDEVVLIMRICEVDEKGRIEGDEVLYSLDQKFVEQVKRLHKLFDSKNVDYILRMEAFVDQVLDLCEFTSKEFKEVCNERI